MNAEQAAEQPRPQKTWAWRQPTPFRQGAIQIATAVMAAFFDQRGCYPRVGAWILSATLVLIIPAVIAFLFAGARGNWRGFGNFLLVLTLLWLVAGSQVPPK